MATVDVFYDKQSTGFVLASILGLAAGDTSEAILANRAAPLAGSLQLAGTFGGNITLEQSNDGVTWFTVQDLAGSDIVKAAASITMFSTAALYLRLSAGTGVSSVNAYLVLRG